MRIKETIAYCKANLHTALDYVHRAVSPFYSGVMKKISILNAQLLETRIQISSLEKTLHESDLSLRATQAELFETRQAAKRYEQLAESRDLLTLLPAYFAKKAELDRKKTPYITLLKGRIIDTSPAFLRDEKNANALLGKNYVNLTHEGSYASKRGRYALDTIALPKHGVYEETGKEELGEITFVLYRYHGQLEDFSRRIWRQGRGSVLGTVRTIRNAKRKRRNAKPENPPQQS